MSFRAFNQPLTVVRRSPGAYVEGLWRDGASETLVVEGSVQPAPSKDIMSLPEGLRTRSSYLLITNSELHGGDPKAVPPVSADRWIGPDGEYEVIRVERWQNAILPHHEVVVTRVEETRAHDVDAA